MTCRQLSIIGPKAFSITACRRLAVFLSLPRVVTYLPTVFWLPAQIRSAAAGLLESSGVPELEARVLSFLGAHAAAVKMLATLDDCVRLLEQVGACV